MFAAGTDTSSIGIEWGMCEVLRNPPVLKKLQYELESVVGMVQESDYVYKIKTVSTVYYVYRL